MRSNKWVRGQSNTANSSASVPDAHLFAGQACRFTGSSYGTTGRAASFMAHQPPLLHKKNVYIRQSSEAPANVVHSEQQLVTTGVHGTATVQRPADPLAEVLAAARKLAASCGKQLQPPVPAVGQSRPSLRPVTSSTVQQATSIPERPQAAGTSAPQQCRSDPSSNKPAAHPTATQQLPLSSSATARQFGAGPTSTSAGPLPSRHPLQPDQHVQNPGPHLVRHGRHKLVVQRVVAPAGLAANSRVQAPPLQPATATAQPSGQPAERSSQAAGQLPPPAKTGHRVGRYKWQRLTPKAATTSSAHVRSTEKQSLRKRALLRAASGVAKPVSPKASSPAAARNYTLLYKRSKNGYRLMRAGVVSTTAGSPLKWINPALQSTYAGAAAAKQLRRKSAASPPAAAGVAQRVLSQRRGAALKRIGGQLYRVSQGRSLQRQSSGGSALRAALQGASTYLRTPGSAQLIRSTLLRGTSSAARGTAGSSGGSASRLRRSRAAATLSRTLSKLRGQQLPAAAAAAAGASRRQGMRKLRQYCPVYCRTGTCPEAKKGGCAYLHDPAKVAVCPRWLQAGACDQAGCPLQHRSVPDLMPLCTFFLQGKCTKASCPYLHKELPAGARICRAFAEGYCPRGAACPHRHLTLRMLKESRRQMTLKAGAAVPGPATLRKRKAPKAAEAQLAASDSEEVRQPERKHKRLRYFDISSEED